jgi:2-dehydro-3-deoxygluconokinase
MSTGAAANTGAAGDQPAGVLTLGETMAALRASGPLRLGGRLDLSVAGAESNLAIGLARLGHAVRWVGVTGDDEFGALVRRTLRAEGVDLAGCRVVPSAPTGLVVFEPRVGDVVRVRYYRTGSAGSMLGPSDVDTAFAAGVPALVHLTGITPALGEGPRAAVAHAARRARASGATVCLDVNYRSRLWSPSACADALRPLVGLVDVAVAGDADPATALRDNGVREVVVKLGGDGATAHTAEGSVRHPARKVPVVDLVGAGDAFTAGYLSGLLDGLDPGGRLDRAVACGAFAVATRGDWEGLPARSELALLDAPPGTTLR